MLSRAVSDNLCCIKASLPQFMPVKGLGSFNAANTEASRLVLFSTQRECATSASQQLTLAVTLVHIGHTHVFLQQQPSNSQRSYKAANLQLQLSYTTLPGCKSISYLQV
jgi:hypothetical protein